MHHRIVLTLPTGGVSIVCPSERAIRWLCSGGYWGNPPRGWLEEQLRRHVAGGHQEWAAARYIKAMQFGRCTEAEALAIIRDRDCAHRGTGIELWHIEDIPTDRTYRDAWCRSHNGGPIVIDEVKAREIDEIRAWQAYEAWRAGGCRA